MPNERQQSRLEMVESLASSIQKKLLEPAGDRIDLVNCELKELSGQVAELEQKITILSVNLGRTRLLACVSLVAAVLLAVGQFFLTI